MTNQTKMSLHRVIAEIKAIESKLSTITQGAFIFQSTGSDTTDHVAIRSRSQSEYDKFASAIANLASLKAARNKANSTVEVKIAGKAMTIDEALALKAALPHKRELIRVLQAQFTTGQRNVDAANTQMEARISQQLATMFTGTRKASPEEVAVIRGSTESVQKAMLVHAESLKANIEALTNEVAAFTTEVDYTLSEANATNTVDVTMV